MKKLSIVIKGNAKNTDTIKKELTLALPKEFNIVERHTTQRAHAIDIVIEEIKKGVCYIIAVGGDGTINEVINGIMTFDDDIRKKIFLGIIPMGTGNDFVRSIKVSGSIKELAQLIVNDKYKTIDLGLCNYTDENKNKKSRYFDNIAEIGIGAKVVDMIEKSNNIFGGRITFLINIVRAFLSFRKPIVNISSKDFSWSGKALTVSVAKGNYYGGGLGIAPNAKLDDKELELVTVGDISLMVFFSNLSKLRKAEPISMKEIYYNKVTSCKIISQEPTLIELDGENVGYTPVEIEVVPKAINVLTNM